MLGKKYSTVTVTLKDDTKPINIANVEKIMVAGKNVSDRSEPSLERLAIIPDYTYNVIGDSNSLSVRGSEIRSIQFFG